MIELTSSTIFLCDFDGTIASESLSDFLYYHFAGCGMVYSDMWAEGKIGTREEIELSFKTIIATREKMEGALSTIRIDPCFHDFYRYCRVKGYKMAILSDGLDWAIDFILAKEGISGVPIFANQIMFKDTGFEFKFPYFDPSTPLSGVCKRIVVEQFKVQGSQVVLVGDGRTDMDAAGAANFVIASDELLAYCREQRIPHQPYKNFCDITAYLKSRAV